MVDEPTELKELTMYPETSVLRPLGTADTCLVILGHSIKHEDIAGHGAYRPGLQLPHVVMAETLVKVPAPQLEHTDTPSAEAKVPAGQPVHTVLALAEA